MHQIDVHDVTSGMRLAKPARGPGDVVLLKTRAVLDDRKIRIIKSWGVKQVWVKGAPAFEPAVDPPDDRSRAADIEAQLAQRFGDLRDNDVMRQIYESALKLLQRKQRKDDKRRTAR